MNAQRRKQIAKIWDKLEAWEYELSSLMDEEQEAFDNLPESLQETERGEKMSNAIEQMDYAISSIEDAIDNIEEAQQ